MNSKNQEGVFNPFESEDDFDQSPHAETDEELEEGKKIAGVVSRRESLQRRIESSSDPVIVEKAQQQLTKMDRADRRKELVSNTFQYVPMDSGENSRFVYKR